ncbi:MAG: hypothetical protein JOZ18_12850 [Chloroflexi bacterium]|nr:hypothetical protein [Chloroflexota bacterium]
MRLHAAAPTSTKACEAPQALTESGLQAEMLPPADASQTILTIAILPPETKENDSFQQ